VNLDYAVLTPRGARLFLIQEIYPGTENNSSFQITIHLIKGVSVCSVWASEGEAWKKLIPSRVDFDGEPSWDMMLVDIARLQNYLKSCNALPNKAYEKALNDMREELSNIKVELL
jgi:hypothetical protein